MNLRRFALLIAGTAVAAATLLVTAGVGAAAPAAPATTSSFTLPAAAGALHGGDLPAELALWTLRGAARAFIVNEDQSHTYVGSSVSPWTPPLS